MVVLVLIIFCAYAQFGMDVFGNVRHGQVISATANFRSLRGAIVVLLHIATGDWIGATADCSVAPPQCTAYLDCGNYLSTAYFGSFYLLVSLLMMKMLVGVVIQA